MLILPTLGCQDLLLYSHQRIVASQLTWQPNLTPGKLLIKEATTASSSDLQPKSCSTQRQKDFLFFVCVNPEFSSKATRTIEPFLLS